MPSDLHRVVNGPDGSRYEVVGVQKDWKLGTGSLVLDAAAFLWAAVRRQRGREWVVTVRRTDSESDPVVKRLVKDQEKAILAVTELAGAAEKGQLSPSDLNHPNRDA